MPETVGRSWQRAIPAEPAQAAAVRAWAHERTGHPDAQQLAGELFIAVLVTMPQAVTMTVSTAGRRARITASGTRPLPLHALHGPGRRIIAHLSAVHGVTPDGAGIWAELPQGVSP